MCVGDWSSDVCSSDLLESRRPEPQLGGRWEDRCVLPNPGAPGSVWERDRNARGLVRREESSGIQTAPGSVAADRSAPREPEESQARPARRARHPAPPGAGLSPAFLPSIRQNTWRVCFCSLVWASTGTAMRSFFFFFFLNFILFLFYFFLNFKIFNSYMHSQT